MMAVRRKAYYAKLYGFDDRELEMEIDDVELDGRTKGDILSVLGDARYVEKIHRVEGYSNGRFVASYDIAWQIYDPFTLPEPVLTPAMVRKRG